LALSFFCSFFRIEIALSQSKAQGKHPSVTIENTELRVLVSKHVLNQPYQIKIDLPESYSKSDTTHYPVLYLTDADHVFGIASDMVDHLRWGEFMPEIIIVGIAYGSKYKEGGNMRARDFRPYPLSWDPEGAPGADLFLKFITDELFPFIEANYRVNKNDKTLFGFSAGGRFGTYVLFTSPDIFSRYIINSSPLEDAAFRLEEKYFNERKDLPTRVYMSMGEFEVYYPPFPRFVENNRKQKL
jgi:predicted alpha/beta superfamily hydrolase